jgi:hypothetical protein
MGVDGIITDRPDLLLRVLAEDSGAQLQGLLTAPWPLGR